jgi:hypothetical protein
MPSTRRSLLAAAGNAGKALYVEDVFSTYLFTTTGGVDTHVNGIDLAGEGGLVWQKNRGGAGSHILYDTERGLGVSGGYLSTNNTNAESGSSTYFTSFNSDGFTTDANWSASTSVASWTFRKAEKFFDIVTYTGDGTADRQIAHNLGSTPGCIIVKRRNGIAQWTVYHRGTDPTAPEDLYLFLDSTNAAASSILAWNNTAPTDSVFTVGSGTSVNNNTDTYVAYLFAHDAGGFGADGSESIIKCGSLSTGAGNFAEVDLGWEPQYVLVKKTNGTGDWMVVDAMRGLTATQANPLLEPNTSDVETSPAAGINLRATATGFTLVFSVNEDYIYIAIRRPMKVPESGTEVYSPIARTASNLPFSSGQSTAITGVGFAPDVVFSNVRDSTGNAAFDRLRGGNRQMSPNSTALEVIPTDPALISFDNDGYTVGPDSTYGYINFSTRTYINWVFKRAPEFMDVVCYTGTGSARTVDHGLTVVPEIMIVKQRSIGATNWVVYVEATAATNAMYLQTTNASFSSSGFWNNTAPTATEFTVGVNGSVNNGSSTYVAYLFATLAGVSKVGSYTGTAASLDLDMGFAAGARFFMCKRTDSTGDWYVYDTARGIVAGNDPYTILNTGVAETTGTDYVDPLASGLTLTAAGSSTININTATYIYLAIA